MRTYSRRLYRVARAILRDDTEAQDVLQDVYVHAYRSMDGFRGESSLSAWLSRLVLNECYARLRRTRRREKVVAMVSAESHMRRPRAAGISGRRVCCGDRWRKTWIWRSGTSSNSPARNATASSQGCLKGL